MSSVNSRELTRKIQQKRFVLGVLNCNWPHKADLQAREGWRLFDL